MLSHDLQVTKVYNKNIRLHDMHAFVKVDLTSTPSKHASYDLLNNDMRFVIDFVHKCYTNDNYLKVYGCFIYSKTFWFCMDYSPINFDYVTKFNEIFSE